AEGLWDNLLLAAGKLDVSKSGGPSEQLTASMNHRAVYAKSSRMDASPFQVVWDVPGASLSSEGRYNTNTPMQRLFFLNSDVIYDRAGALAERVSAAGDFDAQIRKAFQVVYQRDPLPSEIAIIKKRTEQLGGGAAGTTKMSPLKLTGWVLLSSNEFL